MFIRLVKPLHVHPCAHPGASEFGFYLISATWMSMPVSLCVCPAAYPFARSLKYANKLIFIYSPFLSLPHTLSLPLFSPMLFLFMGWFTFGFISSEFMMQSPCAFRVCVWECKRDGGRMKERERERWSAKEAGILAGILGFKFSHYYDLYFMRCPLCACVCVCVSTSASCLLPGSPGHVLHVLLPLRVVAKRRRRLVRPWTKHFIWAFYSLQFSFFS